MLNWNGFICFTAAKQPYKMKKNVQRVVETEEENSGVSAGKKKSNELPQAFNSTYYCCWSAEAPFNYGDWFK